MISYYKLYLRRYLLFFLFLCSLCYVYIWSSDKSEFQLQKTLSNSYLTEKPRIIHWKKFKRNLRCHYSEKDDVLMSVEDASVSPGNNSIFFHETSCRGGINSRVACAVESAARLHPNRQVNFLFSSPVTEAMLSNSSLLKLREFGNINFYRLHIKDYGKGTLVEDLFAKRLQKSKYPIEHAADILRMITLQKFGGVYLDSDSILVKNIDALPLNFIAKESDKDISAGIIALSKDDIGNNLTTSVLLEVRNTYNSRAWSVNGPKAIGRVLKRLCPSAFTKTDNCVGLKIFPSKLFYPIPYKKHRTYFKNGSLNNMEDVYMHHMWNHLTQNMKIEKDSPYEKIAKRFCPTIYEMYSDEFGV